MGRAAVFVDVCAVRRCAEHMYFCTQTCKEFLCCGGRAAVCAVQRHTDAGAVCCNTACQVRDIVLLGVGVLRDRTDTDIGLQLDFFRVIQNQRLDLFFGSIRQLIAGSCKQLDAVELHTVMGCRDHNACICTVCPYQICHSRRGNYAQLDCLCPDRTDSGAEGCLQNIRRDTGVLSDKDLRPVLCLFCQYQSRCSADLHCHFTSQFCDGNSSCAICSK